MQDERARDQDDLRQREARATVTPPDPRRKDEAEEEAEEAARPRANEATKEELEG